MKYGYFLEVKPSQIKEKIKACKKRHCSKYKEETSDSQCSVCGSAIKEVKIKHLLTEAREVLDLLYINDSYKNFHDLSCIDNLIWIKGSYVSKEGFSTIEELDTKISKKELKYLKALLKKEFGIKTKIRKGLLSN
jgi:hypothetical protein